ncbi:MAG: hypothetical protein HY084_02675 [Gemmatimonadetes bacterium]|nr:hypothetical protein [Gemmatimonadota bacterium]
MPIDINNLQVLSWTIQSAMALILLCALVGVVLSFGRTAMRGLMVGWAIWSVAIFADLAGSVALTADKDSPWLAPVSALVLAAAVMMAPWWMHAADVLAGVRHERWPSRRQRWPWILGAMLAGGGVLAGVVSGRTAFYFAQPLFVTVVSLFVAVHAWRRSRGASENRLLLRLLAVAVALIAVRIALIWLLRNGIELREQTVQSLAPIAVGQVTQSLVTGILIVVIALSEERSAVIAQEAQLRDAEARLLDTRRFESLGRLASGVAHDFNNVLTVVMGGLDSIKHRIALSDDVQEDFRLMESAVARAGDLIRQLVSFARRKEEGAATFDAGARLRETVELLRRLGGVRVELGLDVAREGLLVSIDPTRFDQVLMNLVVNARDAMPAGGRVTIAVGDALRLATRGTDGTPLAGGHYVCISVTDTGAGIPGDVRPHIFEPFYTTKQGAGSGLGLATVQRIVREAGGDAIVASSSSEGTRFDILLPMQRASAAGTAAA